MFFYIYKQDISNRVLWGIKTFVFAHLLLPLAVVNGPRAFDIKSSERELAFCRGYLGLSSFVVTGEEDLSRESSGKTVKLSK